MVSERDCDDGQLVAVSDPEGRFGDDDGGGGGGIAVDIAVGRLTRGFDFAGGQVMPGSYLSMVSV